MIEVRTQAELDEAIRSTNGGMDELIVICGDGRFIFKKGSPRVETWESSSPTVVTRGSSSPTVVTRESSSPTVVTRGSSSPTVVTRESSSPRVVTRESSSPTVVTWESSSPRVETWESSSPRVVTWESSSPTVVTRGSSSPTVETWGSSSLTGTVGRYSQPSFWRHEQAQINIPGAVILEQPEVKTAEEWLDYYGVEVEDGVATLFKAVGDDWVSSRGFCYEPGSEPACEDWNPDPGLSCGQGLHFCPAPSVARGYREDATKFVACPIAVSDIVLSRANGIPDKVRAPKVAAPVWECDIDGVALEAVSA